LGVLTDLNLRGFLNLAGLVGLRGWFLALGFGLFGGGKAWRVGYYYFISN
jgi:hypothetical protein